MDEDSHSYYLIKQSETILSQLREQAKKIESAEQKISTNLRNIKTNHPEVKLHPNDSKENVPLFHPINSICTQPMNSIQENSEGEEYCIGEDIDFPLQESMAHCPNVANNEISFANSFQETRTLCQQVVFVPFNKLYRSPVLQMKDKNKLILARKYKGTNVNIRDGKIADGKIYKFQRVVSDEDQLLEMLQSCEGTIALIGPSGTLKKKIHMCLFIKYYQRLLRELSDQLSQEFTLHVEYIEILNKIVVVHLHQLFSFDSKTRRSETCRASNVFQNVLTLMLDKHSTSEKVKSRTRVTRIILGSKGREATRFQVVSSSNESESLFQEFRFQRVIWCINPLVKHYEMTRSTLEFTQRISLKLGLAM